MDANFMKFEIAGSQPLSAFGTYLHAFFVTRTSQ